MYATKRHDRRPLLALREDHAIVAMTGEDVVKVVCRTCNAEHKYRHNKTGKKEKTAENVTQTHGSFVFAW
jgi:RNase P subunit RPR2